MLAGKKPLAAFSERYPCGEAKDSIIPEGVFNSHVESGRIIKREHRRRTINHQTPKNKGSEPDASLRRCRASSDKAASGSVTPTD